MDEDPKSIVMALCREHPKMGRDDMIDAASAAIVAAGTAAVAAAVRAAASSFVNLARRRRPSPPAVTIDRVMRSLDRKVATVVLLDLVMPNQRALRDCTGAECAGFGGWFAAIARRVASDEFVGDVLDEAQLQHLLRAETGKDERSKPSKPSLAHLRSLEKAF